MKITICGSMQHIEEMKKAAVLLEQRGYEVEIPNPREGEVSYGSLDNKARADLKEDLIREHLEKINESDAIFIYNEDKKGIAGYIGGNTLMEMAFAYSQRIEIFLLKHPTGVSYIDEVLGMKPIMLNSDISAIHTYFQGLPTTYVSSESPIKQRAVSRALRRAGIPTTIISHPTPSGVNEQPRTIDETYQGAENRHGQLRYETKNKKPDYLVTIESGWAQVHSKHGIFGVIVTIMEEVGGRQETGIYLEIETPKELTDQIPSLYPDMGVLVQKKFGATLKDPIPYISNGKLTRLQFLESAIFNVAVQF